MPPRGESPGRIPVARTRASPSSVPSVRHTRGRARSTCPPRPALKPVLPHTNVWTTPRGPRLCDPYRSRPGVRHRGHVDRANFVQFGRAVARPNSPADPQSGHGPAAQGARRIPTRLRRVKIRRARKSLLFAECVHSANFRLPARLRRRAVHRSSACARGFIRSTLTTYPPRPALTSVLPHTDVWTTPRGDRLRDLYRSRPFVRHRGYVDNARQSTRASPPAHFLPTYATVSNLHIPCCLDFLSSFQSCTERLRFAPRRRWRKSTAHDSIHAVAFPRITPFPLSGNRRPLPGEGSATGPNLK